MARRKAPDPTDQSPGAKLARLVDRKRKGRELQEIAKAAGMSKAAFSRLLGGDVADPRLKTVKAVLDAIGANFCDYERA